MKNVTTRVEGKKLVVEIELDQDHGPSGSGKSTTVASTGGGVEVCPGTFLNINCYKPLKK